MDAFMSFLPWCEKEGKILLYIKLTPKGAHDRIQGVFYDTAGQAFLKLSVTAPPVDGKANKALIQFLAKKLGLAASTFHFVRGETDRYKILSLGTTDVTLQHLQQTLLP